MDNDQVSSDGFTDFLLNYEFNNFSLTEFIYLFLCTVCKHNFSVKKIVATAHQLGLIL